MALWQFTLILVPRAWIEKADGSIDLLFGEDGYDTSAAWRDFPPKADIALLFSKAFPIGKSWDKEQKVWGNEKTDLQVWYDGGCIDSICVRIDVRENTEAICLKAVEISKLLDCVLLLPERRSVIDPNIFDLKNAVSESRAERFIKDPRKFLEKLADDSGNKI